MNGFLFKYLVLGTFNFRLTVGYIVIDNISIHVISSSSSSDGDFEKAIQFIFIVIEQLTNILFLIIVLSICQFYVNTKNFGSFTPLSNVIDPRKYNQ